MELFKYEEFDGNTYFFCFGLEIPFLEKLVPNYQNCYKYLLHLFNIIMSSFCFDTSALQSSLFINNTE